jgi:hypothetical protein
MGIASSWTGKKASGVTSQKSGTRCWTSCWARREFPFSHRSCAGRTCTALHRTAPHRTAPHRTAPHRTAPHRKHVVRVTCSSSRVWSHALFRSNKLPNALIASHRYAPRANEQTQRRLMRRTSSVLGTVESDHPHHARVRALEGSTRGDDRSGTFVHPKKGTFHTCVFFCSHRSR